MVAQPRTSRGSRHVTPSTVRHCAIRYLAVTREMIQMPSFRSFRSLKRAPGSSKQREAAARSGERLAWLERELEGSASMLSAARARHADAERRGLIAVAAGDNRAARNAFAEQRSCAEEVALLEVDGDVLQEMIDECRATLRRDDASRSARERF